MEYFKAMKKNETYLHSTCVCVQSYPPFWDTMDCNPPGSSVYGFPSKNTEVSSHALLQGIFATQESNPHLLCLLHWQVGTKNGELILNKVIKLYVIM